MRNIVCTVVMLLIASSLRAAPVYVGSLEMEKVGDTTLVKIVSTGKVTEKHAFLSDTRRIVVDVFNAYHNLPAKVFDDLPAGIVKVIRTSQFQTKPVPVTRVVLEVEKEKIKYNIFPKDSVVFVKIITPGYPPMKRYVTGEKAVPAAPPSPSPPPKEAVIETVKVAPVVPESVAVLDTGKIETGDTIRYIRKKIVYDAHGLRDPTLVVLPTRQMAIGREKVPNVEHLKLVGVIMDKNGYAALTEDEKGFGYLLRKDSKVLNGRVEKIDSTTVYVKLEEFGITRRVKISLSKEK